MRMSDGSNPWCEVSVSPPYVAEIDRHALSDKIVRKADLKLDSLPVPWIGDPRSATVLMLGLIRVGSPIHRSSSEASTSGRIDSA